MSDSQNKSRILVVDDEPAIRRMLTVALEPGGFAISHADSGAAALEAGRRNETDMMLLDLGLPDLNGLDVIRQIRMSGSSIPIIVLSSRADEGGKVEAFDLGADDYLTKPFGIEELLARIRALQRYRMQPQVQPSMVEAGDLRINLSRRSVTVRGIEVKLSPREYDLLRLLITHAGKVLTHGYIMRSVWQSGSDIQYLRIYISSIRRKIELVPDQPRILLTEQGVGYRLCVGGGDGAVTDRAGAPSDAATALSVTASR
jgi:two-component system KDP operon response regulator KdpE